MTNGYSLYDASTGIFSGRYIECGLLDLAANVPDHCGCILGQYDHLSQRVDLTTGKVIDYQPPQPSINHVWRDKRWHYVKTDADIAAEVRKERDARLAACDWVAIRASEVPMPDSWREYRAALRDIPHQAGFPRSVIWPIKPQQ